MQNKMLDQPDKTDKANVVTIKTKRSMHETEMTYRIGFIE